MKKRIIMFFKLSVCMFAIIIAFSFITVYVFTPQKAYITRDRMLVRDMCRNYFEENDSIPKTFEDFIPYLQGETLEEKEQRAKHFNSERYYIIENRIEVRILENDKSFVYIYFMDTGRERFITLRNVATRAELEAYNYNPKDGDYETYFFMSVATSITLFLWILNKKKIFKL